MPSIPVLDDEQWSELLEYVAKTYNEVTLSRGFTYFKQQLVATLTVTEDRVVHARVTGTEDYSVTVKLDKLQSSSCTCPVHASCKHQAAVMMELADRYGYPASQIMNARHHLKKTASDTWVPSLLKQVPDMDVEGWHALFGGLVSHVRPSSDQGYYAGMLRDSLRNIPIDNMPFSSIDRSFFELHQQLFILRKLLEQHALGNAGYYTSSALYRMMDRLQAELQQQSGTFSLTDSATRLGQTLHYLRQQVSEENGRLYLHYYLYAALWQYRIASDPEARQRVSQEISLIEQQTVESISPSLMAAKAFLYLLQSRSEEAWAALETGGSVQQMPPSLCLTYIRQLSQAHNWNDLVEWLHKTAPAFYGPATKDLHTYMAYWEEAISHVPEAEHMQWTVLEEMLPHSARIIETLLYERRKWKLWIEMQILFGHDPFAHRASVLQPIEKETPEALLPYYHQAVDHYVSLKNRHDYKAAVRLLKRLGKVYKRLKQTERWDDFLASFMTRHSRLRALQEEIRKGKLLE